MPTLYIVFLSLAVSQLLVLGIYIFLYHRRSPLGLLSGGLVLTLMSGLLGEGLNSIVNPLSPTFLIYFTMALNRIGNVSMFLIWMLSLKLFDDTFEITKVHTGIWVLVVTSLIMRSIGSYYAHYAIELSVIADAVTWVYSQLVLLVFSLAAIYVAIEGWRSDLVIERRIERVIFVICVVTLLLLMVGNRSFWVFNAIAEGAGFRAMPLPAIAYSIYAYFVTSALFLWAFRVVNLSVIRRPVVPALDKVNDEQFARERELSIQIKAVMEEEKLYHESSLTVRALAKYVASQEYLVRKAINNHLGYRNFSEFLNHYRISETSQLLVGTKAPITTIGLNVGYTSLSSFYKAFKAIHDVTPKEYRAQHSSTS
jgi:AraC-like DNA-binding protein